MIDIIKDLGFDGINMYEEGKSNYVVFSPNQIKSVDNKKPTSDPDIRYSISDNGEMQDNNGNKVTLETTDTGTTGTLMAMHNLSEDKLKGILELNGIPVPSIAITDPSKVSFSQFGDGTLLFNKSTIDPAVNKNRVYDRDVWSPTFPVVDNEIISKNIDSVAKEIGIRDYYLEDYAERSHNAEDLFYQVANDEDVVKQYLDKNKIKYDDEMSLRQMRELAEQNGFEEYLKPKLETLYGEKGIYNGKERYTPSGKLRTFWQTHDKYNLANIVKIMTSGGTVDNSSNMFSGGFGSIQANMNHKFTSIQDIKNAESRISPTADTDIETLQDNLSNSISALTEYGNDASGNPFTAFSRTSEVVTEFASKEKQTVETLKETLKDFYWSRADEVPKKVLKSVVDNVNALKNIPTDYFEAKPQRAVGLDEIQAAVISNKWSPEIKQELKNRGIEYIEYDPKVEGARDKAINQYENLKFSISDNNNIAPINKDMVVQDNKQPIAPIRDTNVNTQTENKIAPIREDTKPTTNDPTKETSYDKPVKKITRKTKIQL